MKTTQTLHRCGAKPPLCRVCCNRVSTLHCCVTKWLPCRVCCNRVSTIHCCVTKPPLCRVCCNCVSTLHYTYIKGENKNYTNYTQNPTQTLHCVDLLCVTKCIVCASNYTQTIHLLYTEPYMEAFKTLHGNSAQYRAQRRSKPCTKRSANPALQRRAVYLGAHLSEIRSRLILTESAPSFS